MWRRYVFRQERSFVPILDFVAREASKVKWLIDVYPLPKFKIQVKIALNK